MFCVTVLTANNNSALLISQARLLKPKNVVIVNKDKYKEVTDALSSLPITVHCGRHALEDVVRRDDVDVVLTALVGFSGLKPTISAIKSKKDIALANKETLVVAGKYIMSLSEEYEVKILPVDSEHSAIYQCLVGERPSTVEKIYLTASGGPFLNKEKKDLLNVSKKEALKHPNWSMGAKISIDSATLMNKGLEVIEARWLFNLSVEQIDVVVHPQSIIHSIVQFNDGSMKSQMGLPDMMLPIQYALGFPNRIENNFERFSFLNYPKLSFLAPDYKKFKCLSLAYSSLKKGGNSPCVLNAANEIAVQAFLEDKIGFLNMPDLIANCLEKINFVKNPSLDDLLKTDGETRILAKELL